MNARPKLSADKLYLGDNGRAFCGAMRCAGMTPFYTGKDLSGQRVQHIDATSAAQCGIKCEMCGFSGKK